MNDLPKASSASENEFPYRMCFTEFNEQSRELYKVVDRRVTYQSKLENSKITELKKKTISRIASFMHSII